MDKKVYNNIDEYITEFPVEIQEILQKIRAVIHKAAPDAKEKISYQMPTFALSGNLVHFAAYKHHIGFYPASSGVSQFESELKGYNTSKGTIQFPLDKEIPYDLITKIVKFRVKENQEKSARKIK